MTIEHDRDYCARRNWQMDEASFQMLDDPTDCWIARVTTTRPKLSFYLLMSAQQAVVIESYVLPVLGAYIQVQREKESNP